MSAGPTAGQLRYYRRKHRDCDVREIRASNGEWAMLHNSECAVVVARRALIERRAKYAGTFCECGAAWTDRGYACANR